MTYCMAFKLDEGLLFCSDSRTNAGADRVSVYSKLHRYSEHNDRHLVLLSAGNLATSQAVVAGLGRDLQHDADFNIAKAPYISEIADYVGELSVRTQQKYPSAGSNAGFNAEATFILGGQIRGSDPELYLIYPEGNHITISEQHPFLQIGETKYGKPILDRIVRKDTSREIAMRAALVSMAATMSSNATVGPPIELLFYPRDCFKKGAEYRKFEESDDYLVRLREAWDENIRRAFNALPTLTRSDETETGE